MTMHSDLSRGGPGLRPFGPPFQAILLFTALSFPILGAAFVLFGLAGAALSAVVLAGGGGVAVSNLARVYPHERLGWCNGVTTIRFGLVSLLMGTLIDPAMAMTQLTIILAIAGCAFVLDGVDGWLARRSGLTSEFGARYDVEVDALLSATLALLAWTTGAAGMAILILGFARYVFVFAIWVWPWLGAQLPDRFSRKVVCVVQIAALIYALLPGAVAVDPVVLITAAAVLASFAIDIRWLARVRCP